MANVWNILIVVLVVLTPVIIMVLLLEQWKPMKGERWDEIWAICIVFVLPILIPVVLYLLFGWW